MANALPAIVQQAHSDNGTGSGNIPCSWGTATTAGNLLLAIFEFNDSSGIRTVGLPANWSSALTSTGNGWTSGIVRDGASNVAMEFYYIPNAASQSGSQAFTVSSTATAIVHLYEISGMPASLAVDIIKAQSNATSTTWNSGTTGSILSTDAIAFATWACRNTSTYTAASVTNGFVVDDNRITTNATGGSNVSGVVAHKIGSLTSGGVSSAITVGTSRVSVGGIIVFRNNGAKTGAAVSPGVGAGAETRTITKTGIGISEGVGSGASVYVPGASGTTYTKTGIGISEGVGSGAKIDEISKTGLGISEAVGSGSHARDVNPKSGIGITEGVGSGVYVREKIKSGSGISEAVASGSRNRNAAPKTGSGITEGVASGNRARDVAPKTGIGITEAVGFGTPEEDFTKTGAGVSQAIASGSSIHVSDRIGIGISEAVGSGSRSRNVAPKSGTGISEGVGSGQVDRIVTKTGIASTEAVGSGTQQRETTKTGIGISEGVGSGVGAKVRFFIKSGIGVSQPVGSGFKVVARSDSATVIGKTRILFHEVWSGDADLPHADDIILVKGKIRIRIAPSLYV